MEYVATFSFSPRYHRLIEGAKNVGEEEFYGSRHRDCFCVSSCLSLGSYLAERERNGDCFPKKCGETSPRFRPPGLQLEK